MFFLLSLFSIPVGASGKGNQEKHTENHGKENAPGQVKKEEQQKEQKGNQGKEDIEKDKPNPEPPGNQPPPEPKLNDEKEDVEPPAEKANGNKSTEIHLHLNGCSKLVAEVYVQWNGKWKHMSNPGNSPLYKLKDGGDYVKDDITAFKFITAENKEIVISVSDLRVGVEANGTINYWLQSCEALKPVEEKPDEPEKPDPEKPDPPQPDNPDPDKPNPPENKPPGDTPNPPNPNPTNPGDGTPPTQNSGNQSPATPAKETMKNTKTPTQATLPKTGESSPFAFYLIGLLLTAFGVYLLKTAKAKQSEV
jgi:LPXTG-motif cell wall-anchored protein